VERRLHERYPANLDAEVSDISSPDHIASGRIIDISHSGVCALVPLDFREGAIVRLKIADCSLFGHVIYCRPQEQSYRIGIEVVRVLVGESDLARLLKRVLAEEMSDTPGVSIYERAR
jgi:hypothetical protein